MQELELEIATAESKEEQGQWLEAARSWGQIAARERTALLLTRWGRALSHAGELLAAERVLREAIQLESNWASAYFVLGMLLDDREQLEDARDVLEKGLEREERQPVWTILGSIQRRLGDLTASERSLRRSVELDGEDDEAHYALAVTLTLKGVSGVQEAVAHFQEALRIDPHFVKARRELGAVLWRSGDLAAAQTVLRDAIAQDPDDPWAHDYLGHVLASGGNWEEARDEFQKGATLDSSRGFYWCNLAEAHARLGDTIQARRFYLKALSLATDDPYANLQYGLFLKAVGRPRSAKMYLRRAQRGDPNDPRAGAALDALRDRG